MTIQAKTKEEFELIEKICSHLFCEESRENYIELCTIKEIKYKKHSRFDMTSFPENFVLQAIRLSEEDDSLYGKLTEIMGVGYTVINKEKHEIRVISYIDKDTKTHFLKVPENQTKS